MENLAYQEETWDEMLNGKIVAMSPRPALNHDIIAGNIYNIFKNFLKGKSCMTFGEVDVYLSEKDRVVPDVMIVCNRDIMKENGIYGAPSLVVEILSPSTAKNDRGYKKNLYEKCSVKEYWIVDPKNTSIEVHLLKDDKFVLDEVYSIFPDYLIEKMSEEEKSRIISEFKTSLFTDLIINVSDIFSEVIK